MKMYEVLQPAFSAAVSKLLEQDLPLRVAYSLVKLADRATEEQQRFNTLRLNLLKQFGEVDEAGELVKTEDGSQYLLNDPAAFEARFQELLNLDVEFPTIRLEDLPADIAVKPSEIAPLVGKVLVG